MHKIQQSIGNAREVLDGIMVAINRERLELAGIKREVKSTKQDKLDLLEEIVEIKETIGLAQDVLDKFKDDIVLEMNQLNEDKDRLLGKIENIKEEIRGYNKEFEGIKDKNNRELKTIQDKQNDSLRILKLNEENYNLSIENMKQSNIEIVKLNEKLNADLLIMNKRIADKKVEEEIEIGKLNTIMSQIIQKLNQLETL